MKFRMLHLKRARNNLIVPETSDKKSSGRRNFLRTIGLGMLSLNPLTRAVGALSYQPFEIRFGKGRFVVMRDGKPSWDITEGFFDKGFTLDFISENDNYTITATKLRVKNSNLDFSMKADIFRDAGTWRMDMNVPEMGIKEQIDFVDWLDCNISAHGKPLFPKQKIALSGNDIVEWNGDCNVSFDSGWKISINTDKKTKISINNSLLSSDGLILEPYDGEADQFLKHVPEKSLKITLPQISGWDEYISDIQSFDGHSISANGSAPDLKIVTGTSNNSSFHSVWLMQKDGSLQYNPYSGSGEQFMFSPYFYYEEHSQNKAPEFYLAGRLKEKTQWVSGELGPMQFSNSAKNPGFEAFGNSRYISSYRCELLMHQFYPLVSGAVALPVTFASPLPVFINSGSEGADISTMEDENGTGNEINTIPKELRNKQKQVSVQRQIPASSLSQLKISFGETRLEPRRAIKISLLRPEDLVQLDFEFHNFEFYNKGQGGYLQLANAKEKGTMIVFFPTQHTLEEAWFETAKIPAVGKEEPILLPARQIRAHKSRLVYELPAGSEGFPLMLEKLLDWSPFSLRVHPRAYIKLPSLIKQKPFITRPVVPAGQRTADKLLDSKTGSLEYRLRLIQKNRYVDNDDYVRLENNSEKLFEVNSAATLMPAFNFANYSKLWLKPSPVPDDCTSIEAPALMYISPNQVNDFVHNKELRMVARETMVKAETGLSVEVRAYEDQTGRQQGEIAELWHTRLGVRFRDGRVAPAGLGDFKTIRVLWAYEADPDFKYQAPIYKPFMASLDASDRQQLVHITSNYSEKYTPVPVPVRNLMLTSLGAYLNWHVFFKLPADYTTNLNIIEWQHLATLGRDHYVKVVREGYIFPFGHKAALVKITERKFHDQTRAALNRQRMYVVILEKEVAYNRNDPDNSFIEFPFEKVLIVNDYTPDIDHPKGSTLATFSNKKLIFKIVGGKDNEPAENVSYNFYIFVAGEKFMFDLIGTDKEGAEHKFNIPLVFVENILGRTKENVDVLVQKYNENATDKGTTSFNGQKVAFANSLIDGDTAFETGSLTFNGQYYPAKASSDLKFHPKMLQADIYLKQVEELTGKHAAVQISLIDDDNAGGVFASVKGAKVDFTGGSDKSGGFMSLNLDITSLNRLQGPLGGSIDDSKLLKFDPEKFFKSITLPSAKIFGSIDIFSLLGALDLGGSFDSFTSAISSVRDAINNAKNEILSLESELAEAKADAVAGLNASLQQSRDDLKAKTDQLLDTINKSVPRIPGFKTYLTNDAFHAEYRWQPVLKGTSIEVFPDLLTINVKDPSTALTINTIVKKPFDQKLQAEMNGSARFENFEVIVAKMIGVGFKSLEFKTGSSQKTDVKVDLVTPVPISFMGPLSFVNNLQSIIPPTGFSGDGPYIDLSSTAVVAGFSISVPTIAVGICSIENISLGASVTLPFTGDPLLLAFNFCTRENPFLLTVSCFGGGGFFRMVTSLKQIETVEAAFEFGASMSLDVGVASGSVSVMGGFYFKSENTVINGYDANLIVLTGYIRLNGSLSIIGLITVSLEFYLAFTANFLSKNGKEVVDKLVGEATLKVKVEILFFSTTVSVTVRREIQGADADPKFTQTIFPEDWEEYCLAFAG